MSVKQVGTEQIEIEAPTLDVAIERLREWSGYETGTRFEFVTVRIDFRSHGASWREDDIIWVFKHI